MSERTDRTMIPNSTQCPNIILDSLPRLSDGELKIVLYLVRRTFGFQRTAAEISLGQICNGTRGKDGRALDLGTGLTRRACAAAIERLIDRGLVMRVHQTTEKGGYRSSIYALNLNWQEGLLPSAPGSTTCPKVGHEKSKPSASRSTTCRDSEHESKDRVALSRALQTDVCSASRSTRPSAPGSTRPLYKEGNKGKQRQQQQDGSAVVVAFASQETATATAPDPALVEALIAQGVGRRIAAALAGRDPDGCREQMANMAELPEAPKNPGGWLRRAIEDGFGPPPKRTERTALRIAAAPDPTDDPAFIGWQRSRLEAFAREEPKRHAELAAMVARKAEAHEAGGRLRMADAMRSNSAWFICDEIGLTHERYLSEALG